MTMLRRMRLGAFPVLALLGLLVGTAGSVAADTDYTCPNNTCTFSIPDYYSKLDSDSTSITFKDANSGGVFQVILADFPAAATLDDAVTVVVGQFSTQDSYQADPSGVQNETLSGNPARSFLFSSKNDSGTTVETKVFFSVYQGKLYMLAFHTTPDAEDAFVAGAKGVFDSWQFT